METLFLKTINFIQFTILQKSTFILFIIYFSYFFDISASKTHLLHQKCKIKKNFTLLSGAPHKNARVKYFYIHHFGRFPYVKSHQKPSIFNTVLDIAVLEKTSGSRTGSLSIDTSHDGINSQTHLLHQNGDTDHSLSLANLARRSTIRKRSLR